MVASAALLVAFLSAVFAGWAVWYARRAAVANEQLAAIEADRRRDEVSAREAAAAAYRRAVLQLRFSSRPGRNNTQHSLVIANEGLAETRDVRIEPLATLDDLRMVDVRLNPAPLVLAPGDEPSFLATVGMGSSRGIEFRLSWIDEDGPDAERRQVHRPGV